MYQASLASTCSMLENIVYIIYNCFVHLMQTTSSPAPIVIHHLSGSGHFHSDFKFLCMLRMFFFSSDICVSALLIPERKTFCRHFIFFKAKVNCNKDFCNALDLFLLKCSNLLRNKYTTLSKRMRKR